MSIKKILIIVVAILLVIFVVSKCNKKSDSSENKVEKTEQKDADESDDDDNLTTNADQKKVEQEGEERRKEVNPEPEEEEEPTVNPFKESGTDDRAFTYVHVKTLEGNGDFKGGPNNTKMVLHFDGQIVWQKNGNINLRWKYVGTNNGHPTYSLIATDMLNGKESLNDDDQLIFNADGSTVNSVQSYNNGTEIYVYKQQTKKKNNKFYE